MSWLLGLIVLTGVLMYISFDQLPIKTLNKLSVDRSFNVENCYVNDVLSMKLKLSNDSRLPISWLLLEGELPAYVALEGYKNEGDKRLAFRLMTQIGGRSTQEYTYACTFYKRGYYLFYNLSYSTSDYMGLRRTNGILRDRAIMYVYPSIKAKTDLVDFNKLYAGEKEVRRHLIEDPLITMGSRDYTPRDPMNHIHWNATAKAGVLQVRKFSHSTEMASMILLNAKTKFTSFEGTNDALLESLVSVAAAYVSDFEKNNQPYGLVSNCPISEGASGLMIPCGKGRKHYHKVFRALSLINHYTFCTAQAILEFAAKNNPKTTRLLILTAIIDDAVASAMEKVTQNGFQIEVICPLEVLQGHRNRLNKVRFYPLKEDSYEL